MTNATSDPPIIQAVGEQPGMNKMETLVGYILLVGVLLSVFLILAGTIWNVLVNHSLSIQYTITGENYFGFMVSNLRGLFTGALNPPLLVNLGITTLMFTPYLRVGASVVFFAAVSHNWKYTFFTLFVFAVLTYSLFLR